MRRNGAWIREKSPRNLGTMVIFVTSHLKPIQIETLNHNTYFNSTISESLKF